METAENKILDKIKKLLAKAGSTDSVEEAEALFTMAQKLMVQHRITQEQIDEKAESILTNEVNAFEKKMEGGWEVRLASVIFNTNGCGFTWNKHKNRITIYGLPEDVALVKFFFITTQETFRRLAKEQYKKDNKEGRVWSSKGIYIRSFLMGACDGLLTKIRRMTREVVQETNATGYELVLTSRVEKAMDFIKENVKTTERKGYGDVGDPVGYKSGHEQGTAHNLYIPVEGSTNTGPIKQLN